jgi:hypothetical protein
MESKPHKLKRRRVKKPKSFKQKLKSYFKSRFGVHWKIIILTPLVAGIIILTILLWVATLPDFTDTRNNKIETNVDLDKYFGTPVPPKE